MRWLAAALMTIAAAAAHADVAVVVAHDAPVQALDRQEVAAIFLARATRLPDGTRAHPVELDDNPQRDAFYRALSGKSSAQLESYWATLIFTGRGIPPRRVDSIEELLERLEDTPGTISFVPGEEVAPGMKVVYRIR